MRLPLLALLAVTTPLVAQDSTTTARPANDTVAAALVALERFLAGRDQNPTELWPQLVCVRMAGEENWCDPSLDGTAMPVLRELADSLQLPIAVAGKLPSCAPETGGLQFRVASLRIAGDSAQVAPSLWRTGSRAARMEGCRYHLVRQRGTWVVRPGAPVTCFRS